MILITPISINIKTESNINYVYEMNNASNIHWNDNVKNNATIGLYFGFCFNTRDIIDIYKIIDILPCTGVDEVRPHWTCKSRQMLILSDKLHSISFTKYKQKYNYKRNFNIQGTTYLKFNLSDINSMAIIDLNTLD